MKFGFGLVVGGLGALPGSMLIPTQHIAAQMRIAPRLTYDRRRKYQYPECGINARGKPKIHLIFGQFSRALLRRVGEFALQTPCSVRNAPPLLERAFSDMRPIPDSEPTLLVIC